MKHKLLLLTVLWLGLQRMPAQSLPDCATDWWTMHHLQQSDFLDLHQQYEQEILQFFEQKKQASVLPDNPKTISVVVHIIHENGPENLTNAQVEQAISWLNQAMANQGSFQQGSGTDCGIQFCLAKRTPTNTATNGITRKVNALTNMEVEYDNLDLKNLNRWNPTKYFNIWVVKSICSASYGCGVYGYAHLPYAHGSNIDGIVMEAGYLAELSKIGGLAHEAGHYLGLYHTFEGNCNNNNCLTDGDRICDTPPDASTASVPCNNLVNTCTTDLNSGPFTIDQPDMSWNFLDYGILACFHDFTQDQSTRMNATLEGIRKSLLDSKGCQPPCTTAASASFMGPNTANAGETATFTSNSSNAGSVAWTVNGQPAGNQNTLNYQFLSPGEYVIKLTVQATNPAQCDPDEITKTLVVNCPTASVFTVSNLSPEADQMVYFTDSSENALQTTWYINGAVQAQPLDSLVFGSPGEYSIELVSSNGFCADTQEVVILVQGICVQKTFKYQVTTENGGLTGSSLSLMSDGSFLLSNLIDMPATAPYSPYVSKFKPNGTHLWTKYLEYPTYDLSQTMAKATPDGGFVIFSKFLIFNNLGVIDSFLYRLNKFDLNGNLIWGKLIHREVAGGSQKIDLQVAADGSIFVNASFVSKIDPSGNEIWSTDFTEFNLIRITPDGGLIGILPASNIHLIIKLKPDGTPDWASSFPASNFQLKDAIATPDGDIYILGQLSVLPVGVIHGALIRLNAVGQTIWAKSYRQIPVSSYFFSALNTGDNGDLIVAGDAKVDDPGMGPLKDYHILMSIDTNGVVMWNRHFLENLNMETVTKIPGAGFCMTAAKGWIFRVNELGNTQNCPGTPKNITVTDIPISTTDIQTNLPSFTPQFADEPLALTPVSASLDTLCAPSCLISVEICNNNLDDDGDGLFDCLDTQCNCEEERCASKTGNLWYFGDKSGLDFSTSPPTLLGNGQSSTTSNSATICDAKGNLLLYTDGKQIYNRFHQPMPNANILVGSLVFDVMIIPHPGQTGQYYVLANYDGGKTYYSLVDLTLDDGKGDVVPGQKNLLLVLDVQGMAAIKSCAFNGYWFVTRKFDVQGTFVSFRIDESGINNSPVFSPTNQPVGLVRQLKISPDGQQIACTYYINSVFDSSALSIYRFDPYSGGTITNPQLLGKFKDPFRAYGVEFSPNSRYLYASGTFPGNFQLVQYDLQGGNTQTIISSRIGISKLPGQTIAFLQLGPDHKIYAPTYSFFQPTAYFLDVIHKPNNAGLDCQFEHESLGITAFFPNGTAKDGTCNVIASILAQPEINLSPAAPDTICALGTPKLYELLSFSCGIDSITWTVAGLGAQIQPNFQSATIRYLNYGNGKLIVKAFSSCGNLSDTLDIWVIAPPSTPLNLGPDLEVCDNGVFTFNAGSGFTRYQWSDGSTDSTTTTLFPGVYWVNVWDACGNLQTDTIKVSIQQVSVLNVGTDLPQQCSGFSKTYTLPAGFSSWSWSPNQYLNCSNCPEVTISPETSTNWVVVAQTSEGCISVDTLQALIRDTLLFQLDTFVCQNEALIIFDSLLAPNSTTQFFQPAGSVGCDTLWTVNVAVREASSTAFSVTICNNETFLYLEEHLEPETITTFQFTNAVGCDSMVYITVNSFPSLTLSLPMDTSIRIGDAVALDAVATGSPTLNFSWSPPDGLSCLNCPDPVANPLDTITYTLEVTDANGCVMEKSVQVRVINECDIQVPNAFTPNGDGANDVFRPVLDPCVHTVTLWRVVNRWGQTVFEQYNIPAEDIQLGWDGQRNGEPHPSDVLIWMAEYELYNGERKIESGQVTLIR